MGKQRSQRRVSEGYRRRLQTWTQEAINESNLSYRDFIEKVIRETGVKISYGGLQCWIKGQVKNEISEKSILAISKYRGDANIEVTRQWLWGDDFPKPDKELGKILAWLKQAKPEDVAQVVQAGANVLAEAVKEESVVLPAIAITAQEAGISFEEIVQSSVLDRPGRQLAELYLEGTVEDVHIAVKAELEAALKQLIKEVKGSKDSKNVGEQNEKSA
ncbi:MAG: hypothetical protein F6J86_17390 [Symploca sp. SIO1B1]|nr:hypothetical protein [Symploca sp. SIO2D2]NER95587.1 hypothetical protein [Symploca sp. SIO1B1]